MAASIAPPASFRPVTLVFRKMAANIFSQRRWSGCTSSRSTPGKSPSVISTTVTRLPNAAYTWPSSSPM